MLISDEICIVGEVGRMITQNTVAAERLVKNEMFLRYCVETSKR
jgi:hypothetical protein